MKKSNFYYSRDIRELVEIKESISSDEALDILCDELLGCGYHIVDPVSKSQVNAIIVRDILRNYAPKRFKF